MRHLLSLWILLAAVSSTFAGDIITGTLTVTNAANINSTNAYTIDVNSDTRTWTNSVVDATDEILASTNNTTAVQRLLIHFATYPVSSLTLLSDGSTYVAWRTAESGALTITLNTNTWASVSYATNTVGSAVAVRVPYTVESTATKNAVSDGLMNWLNLAPTNYLGSRKVNWAQSAQTADSAVTNFVANLTGNPYRTITAAANVNFIQSTNRPTAATNALEVVYFITASGANRTLTLNSSWIPTPSAITITNGTIGILRVTGRGTAETDVHWSYGLGGYVTDTDTDTDDQTAAEVVSTPAGTLAAATVQAALDELDTEKVATSRQLTVAGTANEITSSAGAQTLAADRTWTLSLPTAIDLGGKTSLEIPNAAAPTVSVFGQIASDNNLWDTGRGAVLHYDGTAATALVGVLVSDAPSNGQVPKWNTGGTITWEDDNEGVGGSDATAIHDDVAGEIAAVADKATPVGADHLLIEDSADSNNKKDITIASLESAIEAVADLADFQGAVTDAQVPDTITTRVEIGLACSDETTAITTGTGKVTFRMPYAMTVTAVRASVTTAPTGSTIIIDVKESGTTIFSTKVSIDASEKTSTTAASAAVISDASLADDAEMTVNFDQVGSTIAGTGVKLWFIGYR
jgi:hypothetical protein